MTWCVSQHLLDALNEGVSLRVDLVCKPTPELDALNKGNC